MVRHLKWLLVIGVLIAATAPDALADPPSSVPGFSRGTAIAATLNGTTTTILSTDATGKLAHGCAKSGHVVWFTWTADESALMVATTDNSTYDTVLYVFEEHKLVDCDDDSSDLQPGCGPNANDSLCSEVDFQSENGKTYLFAVGAFDGKAGGDTHLNLSD